MAGSDVQRADALPAMDSSPARPSQFLSKKQSVVRQADLAGLGVGQKDMTKGAFQVWTELLQKKVGQEPHQSSWGAGAR